MYINRIWFSELHHIVVCTWPVRFIWIDVNCNCVEVLKIEFTTIKLVRRMEYGYWTQNKSFKFVFIKTYDSIRSADLNFILKLMPVARVPYSLDRYTAFIQWPYIAHANDECIWNRQNKNNFGRKSHDQSYCDGANMGTTTIDNCLEVFLIWSEANKWKKIK